MAARYQRTDEYEERAGGWFHPYSGKNFANREE